jgi:hypothetical protein
MPTNNKLTAEQSWLALEKRRAISLQEAARLKGISVDTLKRYYRDKFIQLSPRRLGMRVGDALDGDAAT